MILSFQELIARFAPFQVAVGAEGEVVSLLCTATERPSICLWRTPYQAEFHTQVPFPHVVVAEHLHSGRRSCVGGWEAFLLPRCRSQAVRACHQRAGGTGRRCLAVRGWSRRGRRVHHHHCRHHGHRGATEQPGDGSDRPGRVGRERGSVALPEQWRHQHRL